MNAAPRGVRLHVGLFGRRNAGKSSLLNALCGQAVSLVSEVAGTTTDPVEKPAELRPVGPVVFIDTAGADDVGPLGALRVARTRAVLDRVDAGIVVADARDVGEEELVLLEELARRDTPALLALNKIDLAPGGAEATLERARRHVRRDGAVVATSALHGDGVDDLRAALVRALAPAAAEPPALVGDLVPPGRACVLVVPIDAEAPRGRLILPQVQAIRDVLDHDAFTLVVKERELGAALACLATRPALVVTDSQAFGQVAADTPDDVPLTSFSILLARQKADLDELARGCLAVERLRPGDRVLVAEACTHHPSGEDIGRVKIPRWLTRAVGGPLAIDTVAGRDFPDDLASYRLVIHCGGCMLNRRAVLARLARCRAAGVPVTNYGMLIAHTHGLLERALGPFPAALEALRATRTARAALTDRACR